jgi:hypothetical protein
MTALFKKLNFKNHQDVFIYKAPGFFEVEIEAMCFDASIKDHNNRTVIDFAIAFVQTEQEIEAFLEVIKTKITNDLVVWMCYPKMSSKNYTCDFNRDSGWKSLGKLNFEPVRQVSINEDFSALRFRKVEYIKLITRKESYALTNDAKARTTQKG